MRLAYVRCQSPLLQDRICSRGPLRFCIPSIADSVTYKSNVPTGLLMRFVGAAGPRVVAPHPGPVGVADRIRPHWCCWPSVHLVSWLRRWTPERNREREEPHEIPPTNLIQESKGLPWMSPDDLAVLILSTDLNT